VFEAEYKLPNSLYRYDFYIPKLGILIEYDGEQHFMPVGRGDAKGRLANTQYRDKEKDKLAALHGLYLIRIPYTELKNLEVYLELKLSKIYKYCIDKVYYRTFLDMCRDLKLPRDTTLRNYKEKIKNR
jgi:very-short-patch-repair endonuclease